MPKDLPGFYFDPERNRYFPIKGRIPGSNPATASANQGPQKKTTDALHRRKRSKVTSLLHTRELYGKVLTYKKFKCNFQHEYLKLQASQPMVWKYPDTCGTADSALEQFHINIQTLQGEKEANVLLAGSMNGSISLYEVGKVARRFDCVAECLPHRVWPLIRGSEAQSSTEPGRIWTSIEASRSFPSGISCIKKIGKYSSDVVDGSSSLQQALVATLGSGMSGGSVYSMNLNTPSDHRLVTSLHCTIWTAECNINGTEAVVGTDQGAALINLESGVLSWVCRSKSDIFSQQFDQSGNIILCGFRNGAITEIDIRQDQSSLTFSSRLPKHKIPCSSNRTCEAQSWHNRSFTKQYFELKGNVNPSNVIFMSSAVCSLAWLQSDDQYFLASSMDGSIKLYDRRLLQRGAIQSFEGHVNSHSHIELGVNPSESLVMSGGEDGYVRIWSIKTGELLFGTKISDSLVSKVSWPQGLQSSFEERQMYKEDLYEYCQSWGAWIGSREALFYMHGT